MAVSSSVRSTILARGYTPEHLAQWEADHPGDEGRALSAFSPQSSSSSNSGSGSSSSTSSRPASSSTTPQSGGGVAAAAPNPALQGLQAALPGVGGGAPQGGPAGASLSLGSGDNKPSMGLGGFGGAGSGGGGVSLAMPTSGGQLRQGLGQRIYPTDTMALMGLQKLY